MLALRGQLWGGGEEQGLLQHGDQSHTLQVEYFNTAGRVWAADCRMSPGELPELWPDPKQPLGNGEQVTWKDKHYARMLNSIQVN